MFRYQSLAAAIGMLALTACEQAATTTNMANPAAAYCVDGGNAYVIRDGANGQFGVCILSDGSEVDAWDFYRAAKS